MMGLYRGLAGAVDVEIISAGLDRTIDAILDSRIGLFSVSPVDELTVRATVRRDALPMLTSLLSGRGEVLRVCGKRGIYWKLRRLIKRPVLMIGAMFLLFLTLWLPTRILFIEVEGNREVSERRILEAVSDSGLHFLSERKAIRSEHIKNKLLFSVPELEWAGINTYGCMAKISVQERKAPLPSSEGGPASIYSALDGIIHSVTVTEGTAKCAVGDAVLKGQILISGYSEHGNILVCRRAEGEIYGATVHSLRAVMPLQAATKTVIGQQTRHYSIIIGKKRINLWKGSGICTDTCDRMYQEYWLKLPGGSLLPFCLVRETLVSYDLSPTEMSDPKTVLGSVTEAYLSAQMLGGRILRQNTVCRPAGGVWLLEGQYWCLEMIGRVKQEEIGENLWQD